MTGARIPEGANTIIPVEHTSEEPGPHPLPESISIYAPAKVGAHVRRQGEDCTPGDVILHAGDVLTPAAIASAVSVGYASVKVYPTPASPSSQRVTNCAHRAKTSRALRFPIQTP